MKLRLTTVFAVMVAGMLSIPAVVSASQDPGGPSEDHPLDLRTESSEFGQLDEGNEEFDPAPVFAPTTMLAQMVGGTVGITGVVMVGAGLMGLAVAVGPAPAAVEWTAVLLVLGVPISAAAGVYHVGTREHRPA